jgi:hypothetical protein
VEREDALDADAVAHLAYAEGGADAAARLADDEALEDLDALLLTLADAVVNLDGVTDAELGELAILRALDGFDLGDAATHDVLTPEAVEGRTPSLGRGRRTITHLSRRQRTGSVCVPGGAVRGGVGCRAREPTPLPSHAASRRQVPRISGS